MKTLALVFVILLIGVQCTSISDKYPALKRRKSLLSLMTTIEAKLSTKAPVQEIQKLVTEYKNSIEEEQLNQNTLFQKQSKECVDEIQFRENEINAATDASNKAQFALDACNAQQARAKGDLENVNNQIAETENYLNQLIATREQEAGDFQKATEAYTFNAEAADEAIDILQQIWSGEATFVQLAKHANKMLMHAIQIRKVHKLTPVMTALAQLATRKLIADEALINNVMNLLRDFRTTIENDYRALEAIEQASIELYNTNRARTEDFLATLKQSKANLEVEISKLNTCIHNQQSIFNTAHAKLQRNSQLLESAKNMCASFQREFESATTARNQELELIEVIKQKLEARYGQVSDLIKKRASQDEFDAYENQSSYQHETYAPPNVHIDSYEAPELLE